MQSWQANLQKPIDFPKSNQNNWRRQVYKLIEKLAFAESGRCLRLSIDSEKQFIELWYILDLAMAFFCVRTSGV